MTGIERQQVAPGICWVEVPEVDLAILCGCPADSVKFLMRRGLIRPRQQDGETFESGPDAILLSDVLVQNGGFANLAEFPVLQMLYRQGMLLPGHPGNTGRRPLLIGSRDQVEAQMAYIHRGNYGLDSTQELLEAGASPEQARELMRLKLRFAFGRIRPPAELLDTCIVGEEQVEIRDGVLIRRLGLNVFQISHGADHVSVDLNLTPHERYRAPYALGHHRVPREYFAVLHSGEGDGWDIHRPSMSSILMFQGRIYLIDAGPSLLDSLTALGISVSELEGVFNTHAHDDHLAGLTTLMRTDRRLRYFATPLVRASVMKKMSALLSADEEHFHHFFEVHDLQEGVWNDVEALQVRPLFSPHPVETTIFHFRAWGPDGERTYAHHADAVDLQVLERMVTEDPEAPGLDRALYERVRRSYLIRADLKKIDVGGGVIHGNAEDHREDTSSKIVLAHTSRPHSETQREIGSGAPFGTLDVLIPGHRDRLRDQALVHLQAYFPGTPGSQMEMLLNNPVISWNPETILLRAGSTPEKLHLVLTGDVEAIHTGRGLHCTMSAGGLVGEAAALEGAPATETYRALGFVQTLSIPVTTYLAFVESRGLLRELQELVARRGFLRDTRLLGEAISSPVQLRLARALEPVTLRAGEPVPLQPGCGLGLVREGSLELCQGEDRLELLGSGDCYGESDVLFSTQELFTLQAVQSTSVYRLPAAVLAGIPVVRLKLLELYERRVRMLVDPALVSRPIFEWRREYRTNVREMDDHHMQLFGAARALHDGMDAGQDREHLARALGFLIEYTRTHFLREEELMREHHFPELETHRRQHQKLLQEVQQLEVRFQAGEIGLDATFFEFLKDWVVDHILTEDRRYGPHLNRCGVV